MKHVETNFIKWNLNEQHEIDGQLDGDIINTRYTNIIDLGKSIFVRGSVDNIAEIFKGINFNANDASILEINDVAEAIESSKTQSKIPLFYNVSNDKTGIEILKNVASGTILIVKFSEGTGREISKMKIDSGLHRKGGSPNDLNSLYVQFNFRKANHN